MIEMIILPDTDQFLYFVCFFFSLDAIFQFVTRNFQQEITFKDKKKIHTY